MSTIPLAQPSDPLKRLSEENQEALKVAVFQRLHPTLYLDRFLEENVRPDGRPLDAFRDISVNVGSISTADGSALVRVGHTTVVCGVKAEIAEPELDRETAGFLVPNVDIPAMCSPKFKPGPPSEEAQVLSERLFQILTTSNYLPLETLVIHAGKSVWTLYVDATVINYDGNVLDATLLAMVAALKNTRLPQATYSEETGRTTCSRKAPKIPLALSHNAPLSVSFGIYNSAHLLADPTSFEEPLLNANISIVVGSHVPSSTSTSTPTAPSLAPLSKLQMRAKGKTQSQPAASEPQKEFALVSVSQTGPSMLEGPNGLRDSLELCVPLALAQRAELDDILEDALSES